MNYAGAKGTGTNRIATYGELGGGGSTVLNGRLAANHATTSSFSLTQATTGFEVTLAANTTYYFEVNATIQSSTSTGQAFAVYISNATGCTIEALAIGQAGSNATRTERISAFNTATGSFNTAATTSGLRISGVVATGSNSVTLGVSHMKTTSGTSTIYANSIIRAHQL